MAALAFNPALWVFKDVIASDIPFLLFSCIALALLDECDSRRWLDTGLPIAAGAAIYACYALRSVGGVLLFVPVIYSLLRFRRIPRGVWIVVLAAGLLMAAQTAATLRNTLSYSDEISLQPAALAQNVLSNAIKYLWAFRVKLFPLMGGRPLSLLFCVLLGALGLWGCWTRWRSGPAILDVFAPIYLTAILMLPWATFRYLLPLLPFVLMYVACGVRALPRVGKWSARTAGAVVVAGGLVASSVAGHAELESGPIRESLANPDFMAACSFLKRETPADAGVISIKPRLSALLSKRRSAAYTLNASDEQELQWFRDCGAQYVLTSPEFPEDQATLLPIIGRHPDLFRMMFQSSDFAIYQVSVR